jgi:hypothetical protein
VIPSKSYFGGSAPYVFTENGVAMLSSVLKIKKAIDVNISIMRTFTKLRKLYLFRRDLFEEMQKVKIILNEHDENFLKIFEYLSEFEENRKQQFEQDSRNLIGFKLGQNP